MFSWTCESIGSGLLNGLQVTDVRAMVSWNLERKFDNDEEVYQIPFIDKAKWDKSEA